MEVAHSKVLSGSMSGAVFEMWNCSFVKNYRPNLDRDIEVEEGRPEAFPVVFPIL